MAVKKLLLSGITDEPVRSIAAQLNGLLAKLDADVGVTDTNYLALWGIQDAITNQTIT